MRYILAQNSFSFRLRTKGIILAGERYTYTEGNATILRAINGTEGE